jgi:biopolymer transport protein ExbD
MTSRLSPFLAAALFACAAMPFATRAADPAAPPPVVTLSAEIIITVSSENLAEASRHQSSPSDMATKLKTIATVFDDPVVILRTDYKTSYARISEMLSACQSAGLTRVKVETGGPVASIR